MQLRIVLIYNSGMIVCICNRISSSEIQSYLEQGKGLNAVMADLGLGSNCGSCLETALELAAACQERQHYQNNTALIAAVAIA
ncbi:MAG: (2Fe-2S)-binding protein [Gammaproteobacteria bacterium]|nr:(2Fe-2S)-binding protein [Gammaproteobacteria bacterium]MBT5602477.1 (2Fe-2S)-binding protein [Gammaproteobacteria bacterium]MBT6245020.1 (2Fe-2S)-binding protein [Gammaproteobacteria bacterium]